MRLSKSLCFLVILVVAIGKSNGCEPTTSPTGCMTPAGVWEASIEEDARKEPQCPAGLKRYRKNGRYWCYEEDCGPNRHRRPTNDDDYKIHGPCVDNKLDRCITPKDYYKRHHECRDNVCCAGYECQKIFTGKKFQCRPTCPGNKLRYGYRYGKKTGRCIDVCPPEGWYKIKANGRYARVEDNGKADVWLDGSSKGDNFYIRTHRKSTTPPKYTYCSVETKRGSETLYWKEDAEGKWLEFSKSNPNQFFFVPISGNKYYIMTKKFYLDATMGWNGYYYIDLEKKKKDRYVFELEKV